MPKPITFPESCSFCGAARVGVQDGRAYVGCKSMIDATGAKARIRRSTHCCTAEREMRDTFLRVQAGQGDSDAAVR